MFVKGMRVMRKDNRMDPLHEFKVKPFAIGTVIQFPVRSNFPGRGEMDAVVVGWDEVQPCGRQMTASIPENLIPLEAA